jgi:hypothetical protein
MLLTRWLPLRALIHLLFPRYTRFEWKTGPPLSTRDSRLRHWLCPSLASAPNRGAGFEASTHSREVCFSSAEDHCRKESNIGASLKCMIFSTSAFLA